MKMRLRRRDAGEKTISLAENAIRLAVAGCMLCGAAWLAAQDAGKSPDQTRVVPERSHPERVPQKPTVAPSFSLPVGPLGFSAPGALYLGQRFSLASLDFLDEDHVLFTFRVPGLIHRQLKPGDDPGDERHIRAVVLSIPDGRVQAEALWSLHDRARYLWMLKDGHFLLRDRNEIEIGDASLQLKPYLRFPGPVLSVALDPSQQFLMTNSREPAAETKPDEVPRPGTASANVTQDRNAALGANVLPDLVFRVLRRDSGQVMLVSRVRSRVDLPINSDGYLEMLPGKKADWVINMNHFQGGSATLGKVESTCTPSDDFVAPTLFLVSTCTHSEMRSTVAMATDGRRLWEDVPASSPVWPVYVMAPDGLRLARESLATNRPVNAYSPISFDDVKGQLVEVFDAATGKIELAAPVSPVFDAGGNVAISPSGRRVAVLNAGAIQVFDLPEPPVLPPASGMNEASKAGPTR